MFLLCWRISLVYLALKLVGSWVPLCLLKSVTLAQNAFFFFFFFYKMLLIMLSDCVISVLALALFCFVLFFSFKKPLFQQIFTQPLICWYSAFPTALLLSTVGLLSDQIRSDQSLSRVRLCNPMNCSTVTPIKSLREFKIVYQNYVLVSLSTLLNLKFSKPGNMTWLSFNTE